MKAHKEYHKILKPTPAQYAIDLFTKLLTSQQNKIIISYSSSPLLPNNVVESEVSSKNQQKS